MDNKQYGDESFIYAMAVMDALENSEETEKEEIGAEEEMEDA